MWELDYKESWAPKNWCFWTVVLKKTLESPLDRKETQPVHPQGDQSWVFIGRTDVEAETPILWPPDVNNWLIRKDHDAGKDWKKEKGTTEDEMVRCHHLLDGGEFEQAPRVDDGQGSLACCRPWSRKESDTTKWLNWTEQKQRPRRTVLYKEVTSLLTVLLLTQDTHTPLQVCLCLVSDLLCFSLESIFIPFLSKCVFLLCSVLNKHCFSVCFPIHFAVSLINFVPVFTVFTSLKHSYFQKEERARVSLVLASSPWSSCG